MSINANIRYADFQNVMGTYSSSGLLTAYDVPENMTLWVGLCGSVEKNGTVEVKEVVNHYQWKVDGESIRGTGVTLEAGKIYHLELWYKNELYSTKLNLNAQSELYCEFFYDGTLIIKGNYPRRGIITVWCYTPNTSYPLNIKVMNE